MQNATRPDVDKLISGGQARKRRRNRTWAVGAAVAVVLVAGGVYAATQLDGSEAGATGTATTTPGTSAPSGDAPPPTLSEDGGPLEPGTYRLLVGTDATGAAIEADLTFEGPRLGLGELPGGRDRRHPRRRSASTGPRRSRPGPAATATRRTPTFARAREPSRGSSPGSRKAPSSSPSHPPRRTATTPSTCGSRSPTTVPRARGTASRRRRGAVTASATASSPRRSSWTSGSWTWTASRWWSTRGTRATPRRRWWTRSTRPASRSPSSPARRRQPCRTRRPQTWIC